MYILLLLRNEDPSLPRNVLSCPKLRSGGDRYILGESDLSRNYTSLIVSYYLNGS